MPQEVYSYYLSSVFVYLGYFNKMPWTQQVIHKSNAFLTGPQSRYAKIKLLFPYLFIFDNYVHEQNIFFSYFSEPFLIPPPPLLLVPIFFPTILLQAYNPSWRPHEISTAYICLGEMVGDSGRGLTVAHAPPSVREYQQSTSPAVVIFDKWAELSS